MKKLFVLVLSLVLVMALAACGGGQTAGSAQQDSSAAQSGAATSGTDTPAGTETPSAPGSDVPAPADPKPEMTETVVPFPEEAKGAADLLPKLPDGAWSGSVKERAEQTVYSMGMRGVTKDVAMAYADAVKAAGYTNDPKDYPDGWGMYDIYLYYGSDADGMVRVMVGAYTDLYGTGDKGLQIEVAVEKYAPVPGGTWNNGMADHVLPQLPAGEWKLRHGEMTGGGTMVEASVYGMSKDAVVSYVEELKRMGYTNAAEEHPDGIDEGRIKYDYKYTAKNADGSVQVEVVLQTLSGDKLLTTVEALFFD